MNTTAADVERLNRYDADTCSYTLAIVTDEDRASQVTLDDGQVAWQATIRYDLFERTPDPDTGQPHYSLTEIPPAHRLTSLIAEGGRGAEFSELIWFGGRLIAFDDRTGLVCEVRDGHQLIPRQILMTGSGDERFKGFKAEWATLKGDHVIAGSHGKTPAESWIKCIDRRYGLESRDWQRPYRRMREALGVESTPDGYVIHEAAEWHPERRRWLFFPRKISAEPFDEERDERERGGNTLIIADEDFQQVDTLAVGERVPERGVSSFKILPGHTGECVGLKSVEIGDRTEAYLFCFDLDGNVLLEDTWLGAYKCEGVEIL